MIPTIGIMIGGYIILRCVDIFSRPLSAFKSQSAQTFMLVFAIVIILATMVEMADLAFSGASTSPAITWDIGAVIMRAKVRQKKAKAHQKLK